MTQRSIKTVEYCQGDLLKAVVLGKFDIILQCNNCFNVMGKGIAKEIKQLFPKAYEVDCATIKGDINKLGNYTYIKTKVVNDKDLIVVNGYMQYRYGKGQHLDYRAMSDVFDKINAEFKGMYLGTYRLGCHNAGGDWDIVKDLIETKLTNLKVTVMDFSWTN